MIHQATVVIPAWNEEDGIAACLRAVGEAIVRCPVPARCVLSLDGCTDATAEIAARFPWVAVTAGSWRSVGRARAAGVRAALDGVTEPAATWIACTDADSAPPPEWLAVMVELADAGADVVCGTVAPRFDHPDVGRRWQAGYDSTDGHPHVHGANLGLRASTYLDAGGFEPLVTGEDAALVASVTRTGRAHLVRSGRIPVVTSGRYHGRAPHGVAADLRRLCRPEAQIPA